MNSQSYILGSAVIISQDGGVSLEGNLLFSTVSSVLSEGCKIIEKHASNVIVLDMSKVKKVDSAGIALLLNWKRLCDLNNKKFYLKSVPDQAMSLIDTNNLGTLLNIKMGNENS